MFCSHCLCLTEGFIRSSFNTEIFRRRLKHPVEIFTKSEISKSEKSTAHFECQGKSVQAVLTIGSMLWFETFFKRQQYCCYPNKQKCLNSLRTTKRTIVVKVHQKLISQKMFLLVLVLPVFIVCYGIAQCIREITRGSNMCCYLMY